MVGKIKKRKKYSRAHGRNMGTAGHGARKKNKGSGHKGGKGMSGSGKRADHKKTLVNKLYGNNYFGKQGITSKSTKRDTRKRIGLKDIDSNIENYVKKGLAKKTAKGYEIKLEDYKILGRFDLVNVLIVSAKEFSKGAVESIEKKGGKAILIEPAESNKE